MNTVNHLSPDDLALFVLQLLPAGETRDALLHMQTCDACRTTVGEFQSDLGMYLLASEAHTPPPAAARERLLRLISDEKWTAASQGSAVTPGHTNGASPESSGARGNVLPMPLRAGTRQTRPAALAWAGWALAAGFAGLAALQFHERRLLESTLTLERAQLASVQGNAASTQVAVSTLTDPSALNVTLREPSTHGPEVAQSPQGHAAYLPDRGALVFVATNMEPLKPYKIYELWLLPSDSKIAPIPAASFRPDSTGKVNLILPTGPRLVSVQGFGVTLEDEKSPPRKPTLPILLAGSSKA